MILTNYWVCGEKEFFCHLLMVFVVSIYVGVSLTIADHTEALLLKDNINMMDISISETNNKLKASNSTLLELVNKYSPTYTPYESRCLQLDEEILKNHNSKIISINFQRVMATKPNIVIAINGIKLTTNTDQKPATSEGGKIDVMVNHIQQQDVFLTHFNFRLDHREKPLNTIGIYFKLKQLDICYLAFLP